MGLHDPLLNGRRFLSTAALTVGAMTLALPGLWPARTTAPVPPQLTLPERAICDTATASA
ncbi:hypothetical protein ACIRJO_41390 [Streptomyces sp. NPDC102394]|uniref:hypothetical protein n=1 Tax=Streptomyces sp. NPDC102394 TaxID=3366167 RepID=UPI003809181B